ncbi:MAG: BrnT family toxin [Myxococcaceae bacterium]
MQFAWDARTILIGESHRRRVLFTVFVERDGDTIRIISARRATAHERKRDEEGEF